MAALRYPFTLSLSFLALALMFLPLTGCSDGLLTDFECSAVDNCDYWNENISGGSCIVTVNLPGGGTYSKCTEYTGALYQNNGELVIENCNFLNQQDLTQAVINPAGCSTDNLVGSCQFNLNNSNETTDYYYYSDDLTDAEIESLCSGLWEAATTAADAGTTP